MNLNILQKATKIDLVMDPYPHLIIENALPQEIYDQLAQSWPETFLGSGNESITNEKDHTKRYLSAKAISENNISELWKEFFKYHTSNEFYHYAINLLSDAIKEYYPDKAQSILNSTAVPRTHVNQKESVTPFVTDCQFVMNYPLKETETSRTAHLDNPQEIYAALFYMRKENDFSTGRDFQIFSSRTKTPTLGKKRIVTDNITVDKTVDYKPNTVLLFLNCRHGVHGVSTSSDAITVRRHINVIGEFGNGTNLFQL